MDETLVHTIGEFEKFPEGCRPFTLKWDALSPDGKTSKAEAITFLRPGVFKFLRTVTEMFEVVFFTASTEKYAKQVTKLLDIQNYRPYLLTRKDCTFKDGLYIKDLSTIPRELKNMIIIDNLPDSYLFHPANGLPIESWLCNPQDDAFTQMITVLQILYKAKDVRPLITQCVVGDNISLYRLYKAIGPTKNNSPIQGIIGSFKDLKDGAAAMLGFSEKETTGSSAKEEDDQENRDNNTQKVRLDLPESSEGYSKSDYSEPEPTGERIKVCFYLINVA